MPALRAIRLLNSVEGGTVSGTELESYLSDSGRLAEFKVLLSMRGQTRRMAASALTVNALITSSKAIDAVFTLASSENSTACQAIVARDTAMASVSLNLESLIAVTANPVAWNIFSTSPFYTLDAYAVNSKNAIATLAGVNPSSFATIELLFSSPSARLSVTGSATALQALFAHNNSVAVLANDATGMSHIAESVPGMNILTNSVYGMQVVSNSVIAMAEITPKPAAMAAIAGSTIAMPIVYSSVAGWAAFKASPFFGSVVPTTTAILAGLDPNIFPTLASIIDSPVALAAVSANGGASQALAASSAAMLYLATSPSITAVVDNPTIMAAFAGNSAAVVALAGGPAFEAASSSSLLMNAVGANTAALDALVGSTPNYSLALSSPAIMGAFAGSQGAMTYFIGDAGKFIQLMGSSAAKGAFFESNIAIDTMAATPSAITHLKSIAVTTFSTTVPNGAGRAGAFEPFGGGVPAKVLVMNVRQAGIAAIPTAFQLATGVAGAVAGEGFNTIGTGALAAEQFPQEHFATYSNLTVKTAPAVIAITGVLGIRYVSMV